MSYQGGKKDESNQSVTGCSFGRIGSDGKTLDYLANKYRHVLHDSGDRPPPEGLIFPEQYLDGHINVLGVLGRFQGNSGVVGPNCQAIIFENVKSLVLDNHLGRIGVQITDIETVKSDDGTHRYDEFVLVGNVEYMKTVKKVVPARVRLKIAKFFSDFFAGDLYLSIRQNRLKTIGFPTKGELDFVRNGVERAKNVPSQMIERGPEIVNCIPDNHGEVVGNGRVYIDDQGALAALCILNDGKPASIAIKQSLGLGNKVFDVMLGPL